MVIRRPTELEYAAYDGMHCHGLWRATPESWRRPGCGRSKRGILIWGVREGHKLQDKLLSLRKITHDGERSTK